MKTASSDESVITAEMQGAAGRVISQSTSLEVTVGDIRRWASAISYPALPPQEFWARAPIIAPEDFNPFSTLCAEPHGWQPRLVDYAASVEGALGIEPARTSHVALNAAVRSRYFSRVRPGDVITATEALAGYRTATSRRGPVLLTITKATWTNQLGKVVKKLERQVARFIDAPSDPPPPRFHEPSSSFPPFTRPGTLEVWNRFAAANDELYDIHMDSEAAKAFGASTAFGLGSQLAAYVHAAVREWLPGQFIRAVDCHFLDSWLLGFPVTVVGRPIDDGSEIDVHVIDSETRLLASALVQLGEDDQ